MVIKVLGSTYKVIYIDKPTEYMKENDFGGMADYNKKEITVINKFYGEVESFPEECDKTEEFIDETLLHELAHVFLNESGQDDINNERTVEVMSKFCKFVESIRR